MHEIKPKNVRNVPSGVPTHKYIFNKMQLIFSSLFQEKVLTFLEVSSPVMSHFHVYLPPPRSLPSRGIKLPPTLGPVHPSTPTLLHPCVPWKRAVSLAQNVKKRRSTFLRGRSPTVIAEKKWNMLPLLLSALCFWPNNR